MTKLRCRLTMALIFGVWRLSPCYADEVDFGTVFATGALGDDVVVAVADNDVLVFGGDTTFIPEGRNIFIRAKRAVLRGNVEIRAFSETSHGPATMGAPDTPSSAAAGVMGTSGGTGKEGAKGAAAGTCVLDIGVLEAQKNARLIINFAGQRGGPGQMGGIGGQGGQGGTGRGARGDWPSCSRPCPDQGASGLPGGSPGRGGPGGIGGKGGSIYRSPAVLAAEQHGYVQLDVRGGGFGTVGGPGSPGIGGLGGPRGPGSSGCVCRDEPPLAPNGASGASVPDPPTKEELKWERERKHASPGTINDL